MAQAVGSARTVTNGQDVFGGHLFGAVDYTGPAAYVAGGDSIDPHIFGFPNTIVALWGSAAQDSAAITVVGRPLNNGVTAWQLVWYSDGTETSGDLSGHTVRLSAIGY